jgi:hypothetical protein
MAAHRLPFFGHAIWRCRCLEATHKAQELRGYDTVAFDCRGKVRRRKRSNSPSARLPR